MVSLCYALALRISKIDEEVRAILSLGLFATILGDIFLFNQIIIGIFALYGITTIN